MKHYCALGLLTIVCLFAACDKQEPIFFDAGANGVYFNYNATDDLSRTINFANYSLENPSELPVTLKLRALGFVPEKEQKVVLKVKAVEGYSEAEVVLPEIVFQPDETDINVQILVKHPSELGTTYAACIYIDSEDPASQFGEGINGFSEFTVYVSEKYDKPEQWSPYGDIYLGEWTVEKQIFLIQVTKNNNFAASNYYADYIQYNLSAVDSLRKFREENPGTPVTIEIPFSPDRYVNYKKPPYWTALYDKYFGNYSSATFATVCNAMNVTTANDYETFVNEEDAVKGMNKIAVKGMMEQYDQFFQRQYWGNSYRQYWIPMIPGMEYEVWQPACWADAGCAALLEKYYGDYSDSKYEFMINTWLSRVGTANFVLVQMFPVRNAWKDQGFVAEWDMSIRGENAIKECYKAFTDEYKKNPSAYDFTFPDVSLN